MCGVCGEWTSYAQPPPRYVWSVCVWSAESGVCGVCVVCVCVECVCVCVECGVCVWSVWSVECLYI